MTGKEPRASKDGITWRNLPAATPAGKVIETDKGTLISVHRNRLTILRSTDGMTWNEVHQIAENDEQLRGPQGFVRAAFGHVNETPLAR
jgi:hypothetical protein